MSPAERPGTAVDRRQADAVEAGQALVATVRGDVFRAQVADALPDGVSPARFVRATATALLANPDVALCDHTLILRAMLRAASDGLVPDGREAAIVLRKGEPVYTPMVGGYRKIAAEYGWQIAAAVVYERDEFDYVLGLEPNVLHRPALGDRGTPTHAYAIGRHRDPGRPPVIEVMDLTQIEKRRKAATTDKVWSQWWDRMAEKTVARAVFGRLPLDPADQRIARLAAADELDDGEAAAKLYGPPRARAGDGERVQSTTVAGELPARAPAESPRPSPQAGPGDEPAGSTAGPAGDEPELDRAADEQGGAPADDGAPAVDLEAARAVVIEGGSADGMSLGEIASNPGALTWFTWALANADRWDDETRAAIDAVAAADVPDATK